MQADNQPAAVFVIQRSADAVDLHYVSPQPEDVEPHRTNSPGGGAPPKADATSPHDAADMQSGAATPQDSAIADVQRLPVRMLNEFAYCPRLALARGVVMAIRLDPLAPITIGTGCGYCHRALEQLLLYPLPQDRSKGRPQASIAQAVSRAAVSTTSRSWPH